MVRAWKKRRAERRGSAKRGKKLGEHGGGRLSPAYDIVVEVWPKCHLTWNRGTYTRTVTDILNGKAVNILYVIHRSFCVLCRREAEPKVQGAMPGFRFGNNLIRYAVDLRVEEKMTYASVVNIIMKTYSLEVTAQTIHDWCLKAAELSKPVYEDINRLANEGQVLHVDETGMPVDGANEWLWVKVTKDATVYRVYGNRGSKALQDLFQGWKGKVAVSDFYPALNAIGKLGVMEQRCVAHLLRLIGKALDESRSPLAEVFIHDLKELFSLRSTREAEAGLDRLLDKYGEAIRADKALKRLCKLLKRHRNHLFTYMDQGEVPRTNNLAEREIRPFIVLRKRAQCFRSEASAEAHARLLTVWRTRFRSGQPWLAGIL
ncbi:IS66 family transposase [Candidatus Bathyarchaeota archaeon]|nr:IS66 family transposase [Candidatus Bathyarchaeota archaeon]